MPIAAQRSHWCTATYLLWDLHCRSRKATSSNALINFFASCPDNAFQRVPPGMEPFSLLQRVGAILRNGTKLLGVGFCASLLGERE